MTAVAHEQATNPPQRPARQRRQRGRVRPGAARKQRQRQLRQLQRRTRTRSEARRLQRQRFAADQVLAQELEVLDAELARRQTAAPWWRRLPGVGRYIPGGRSERWLRAS